MLSVLRSAAKPCSPTTAERQVTVRSEIGEGSTFTVTLALEASAEVPAKEEEPQMDTPTRRSYDLDALVVEDNPVNQLVIRGYLEGLGLSVVVADNGRSALKRVSEQAFDLIFMDVRLPVLDGLETTRHIRAEEGEGERVPIIALTANAFAEDRDACLAAGMDLHLRKPMLPEDLEAAIETLRERGPLTP